MMAPAFFALLLVMSGSVLTPAMALVMNAISLGVTSGEPGQVSSWPRGVLP
jgi:hypothetical protein